jgi:hypothetical protein
MNPYEVFWVHRNLAECDRASSAVGNGQEQAEAGMVPVKKDRLFRVGGQEIQTRAAQKATAAEAFRPTKMECAVSRAIVICEKCVEYNNQSSCFSFGV